MKKITFVLFIVMCLGLYASGNQYRIQDNDGNTLWAIRGAGADTSRTYKTDGTMTIFYWTADTTGSDSVDLDLSFQEYGSYGWYTEKTITITTDSTNYRWLITNSEIGSRTIWRLIVAGGGDNKKGSTAAPSSAIARLTYDSGN